MLHFTRNANYITLRLPCFNIFLVVFFFLLQVGEVEDDLDVDVSESESESVLKKSKDKLTSSYILSYTF